MWRQAAAHTWLSHHIANGTVDSLRSSLPELLELLDQTDQIEACWSLVQVESKVGALWLLPQPACLVGVSWCPFGKHDVLRCFPCPGVHRAGRVHGGRPSWPPSRGPFSLALPPSR